MANARTYVCENEWGCDLKESENEEREKGEEDCFFPFAYLFIIYGRGVASEDGRVRLRDRASRVRVSIF